MYDGHFVHYHLLLKLLTTLKLLDEEVFKEFRFRWIILLGNSSMKLFPKLIKVVVPQGDSLKSKRVTSISLIFMS